ncbi:hypothetical protein RHGRI_016998 [Rhododendron griersonianum]|uniref:Uncharacterized protein n=1 Tax=Rhododendron griersonianum TaxID=479676 RepID=A0AAV6JW71_9ERIC|nr:hypothetical protein RHGRI_016998 [Rhododendron griersonianum]
MINTKGYELFQVILYTDYMDLSKDPYRRLEMAAIMVAGKQESLISSMGRKHAPNRHTFYQTQRLEA